MSKKMIGMVAVAGLVLALAPAAQAATMQIGPGADLAGATMADTANQERLNVARTDTLVLAAGTYDVLDFQLNVLNHNTGTGDAGTITPMLLTGSPSSYTTLWVGSAFDPSSNGAQTAATYAPTTQTFTLAAPGPVFGGFFTGNNGSAIPAIAAASAGADDHDNSFTAPTGAGEAVAGPWTVNGWNRSYAFEINVDADPGDIVTPTGQVTPSNGNSSAVGTDLLQTNFGSVVNSGVGGPAGGDGPDGPEPVLRDGTATDTSGYANGSLTAARVSNGDVLTYTLDTSVNTAGYQIDQVDMFHGWKDGGRDRIADIDVAYATVAAPGTFLPILDGGSSGDYGASYGRTSVVPGGTNTFLATDVAAVRITFDGIENGYGGISEIDILGTAVGGPPPPVPAFSTATLTGDADSRIAANKLYTHTVDTAGTAAGRSVNNVQFERALPPAGGNASGSNWSITGANNGVGGQPGNVTGDIGTLVGDFWYNGNPQTTTLTGLEPGKKYVATWYGRGWGDPGTRVQTITTDDGAGGPTIDTFTFDENFSGDGNGNMLTYSYTAPASGSLRVSFAPQDAGTFHQHAFTNELVPGLGVLLADSFNSTANTSPDVNHALRQTGSLAPTGWTIGGNAQVGNGGTPHPGVLLLADGGWAGLNQNFNGALSDGGLSVNFDVDPKWTGHGGAGLDQWGAISLGADDFGNGWVNRGGTHFGILFRGDGRLQAFDGGTNLTPVEPRTAVLAVIGVIAAGLRARRRRHA